MIKELEMRFIFTIYSMLSLYACGFAQQSEKQIKPGEIWKDSDENPINAHGGGILFDKGTYYWYGEYKKGTTYKVPYIDSWECYRLPAQGISCYSSKDLKNWKFEGLVLKAEHEDSQHDLHSSKVIERPKVLYNEHINKYVMWLHVDSEDYSYARAGVAISDNVTGPFQYIGSTRPNGNMSRDMTLFKDDDGKAYHIYSSENNATMHISLLSEDYLSTSGKEIRIFEGKYREAPAIVKFNKKYYLFTSNCTGWDPNEAMYAVADSILGKWEIIGNPCTGRNANKTFHSQSTFILPVGQNFIFMADRWNKKDLEKSRYVWLPLQFKGDKPELHWMNKWNIN